MRGESSILIAVHADYTQYAACARATNGSGASDWMQLTSYWTLPGKGPTPKYEPVRIFVCLSHTLNNRKEPGMAKKQNDGLRRDLLDELIVKRHELLRSWETPTFAHR